MVFFKWCSGKQAGCLTKRAPDAWDSVHIPSSFPRLSLFLVGRLRRPRPSAGIPFGDDGANRWLAKE